MASLVLTQRGALPGPLDGSVIRPDRLAGLSLADIGRLSLTLDDGRTVALAGIFAASGEPSDTVHIAGDLHQLRRLGAGMESGTLLVEGSVGDGLGERMRGGRIEVSADAGDDAGREMAGGTILIRGSAGARTGSAMPGAKRGITGGAIVIFGDAGPGTGAFMRRGLIAVAGHAGPDTARTAIAGTVVVGGDVGPNPGRFNKRGTIVALGSVTPPVTYRYACTYHPPVIGVMLGYLRATYGFPVTGDHIRGLYRRFSGDLGDAGKGEILHWTGETGD
ncbi:MAG: formylmethanofuran dehydrogenase subunit C [Gemmatimonadota bacterium]